MCTDKSTGISGNAGKFCMQMRMEIFQLPPAPKIATRIASYFVAITGGVVPWH